jgi:hypothetical protein
MRARFGKFGKPIAYSTRGSRNLGIGMDLSDASSWPLRSPGILARRALCGFLPLRRQLLDQPSWRCETSPRCGTLATNSMPPAEQIMCHTRRVGPVRYWLDHERYPEHPAWKASRVDDHDGVVRSENIRTPPSINSDCWLLGQTAQILIIIWLPCLRKSGRFLSGLPRWSRHEYPPSLARARNISRIYSASQRRHAPAANPSDREN